MPSVCSPPTFHTLHPSLLTHSSMNSVMTSSARSSATTMTDVWCGTASEVRVSISGATREGWYMQSTTRMRSGGSDRTEDESWRSAGSVQSSASALIVWGVRDELGLAGMWDMFLRIKGMRSGRSVAVYRRTSGPRTTLRRPVPALSYACLSAYIKER